MAKQLTMNLTKPSKNKIVDNILTRLTDLSKSLDGFYEQLDRKMNSLNFDEVNSIIIDGFRNVIDEKCPIDVVPDAESCTETFSYNSDEEENGDEKWEKQTTKDKKDKDEEEDEIRKNKKQKEVEKILEIMRSMSS